jgi:predicted DNA-binding transcriptional regulator YafY
MSTALTPIQEWVLAPQCQALHSYLRLRRREGISAREAMLDLQMTSATLARRICDLEEAGINIERLRKCHPVTRRRYTRYVLG